MSAKQVAFGAAFVGALLVVQPLRVEADPDPNLKAKVYRSSLVQAMDECTAPTMTNVGGVAACSPSNTSTDGSHFVLGRITIRNVASTRQVHTLLKSSGTTPPAALAGKVVRTVIVLRVTRSTGGTPVTWIDQVLDCPPIAVLSNGNVLQKTSLASCGLAPELNDNATNKEVIAVQVVDDGTGEVIAVPGVRRNH